MSQNNKGDQIIWYLMITAFSILILGGGAWATNINSKIERIATLELNIQYIQSDLSEIKQIIKNALIRRELDGKPSL